METPALNQSRPSKSKTNSHWVSRLLQAIKYLYSRPSSALGTSIVLVFIFLAVFGPLLTPFTATEQIYKDASQPPSITHWFGTDNLGRDIFSRVIYGAREILMLAGAGTMLAVVCGIVFGLVSGYRGGWFDEILMRIFDSFLALPALLLALLLLGTIGPTQYGIMIIIVVVYTPIVTRVARSVVIDTRTKDYVDVSRLQGESTSSILQRDIFPSLLPALTVEGALRFSYAIFLVASLGFLGVGVQPPNPNWGLMVKEARDYVSLTPWALIFPVLAISITVIGVNLTADGIKNLLMGDKSKV